jgi:anti-sigma factor RsiW
MAPACQHVAEMISEFLDGELGELERWEVTLHLDRCANCTRFAAELAATIGALHALRRDCAGVPSRDTPKPGGTTSRSTAPPSPGRSRPSSS